MKYQIRLVENYRHWHGAIVIHEIIWLLTELHDLLRYNFAPWSEHNLVPNLIRNRKFVSQITDRFVSFVSRNKLRPEVWWRHQGTSPLKCAHRISYHYFPFSSYINGIYFCSNKGKIRKSINTIPPFIFPIIGICYAIARFTQLHRLQPIFVYNFNNDVMIMAAC